MKNRLNLKLPEYETSRVGGPSHRTSIVTDSIVDLQYMRADSSSTSPSNKHSCHVHIAQLERDYIKVLKENKVFKENNKRLLKRLEEKQNDSEKNQELKYAPKITQKAKKLVKSDNFVRKRIKNIPQFVKDIQKPEKYGKCLLKCLCILNDLVKSGSLKDKENLSANKENDSLIDNITAESQRILKLNKEIKQAIRSTK